MECSFRCLSGYKVETEGNKLSCKVYSPDPTGFDQSKQELLEESKKFCKRLVRIYIATSDSSSEEEPICKTYICSRGDLNYLYFLLKAKNEETLKIFEKFFDLYLSSLINSLK